MVGDVVLNLEGVFAGDFAVVGFGPELRAALRVGQLGADADGGAAFADAAFEHVAGAKRGPLRGCRQGGLCKPPPSCGR